VIHSLRLPFYFDLVRLREDLDRCLQAAWHPHFNRGYYEGDWSGIDLRASPRQWSPLFTPPDLLESICDLPLLRQCPYFLEVLAQLPMPLQTVRLLRLAPGGHIRRHRDVGQCFEQGEVRIHIPILTHDGVRFLIGDEHVAMAPGECWYLNFDLPHEVRNPGPDDRVHLVIDAQVNDALRELFERAPRHRARATT
jgi:mannose-6-phosphate isomerase-like protein (cupin superfamily)